MINHHIFKVF